MATYIAGTLKSSNMRVVMRSLQAWRSMVSGFCIKAIRTMFEFFFRVCSTIDVLDVHQPILSTARRHFCLSW